MKRFSLGKSHKLCSLSAIERLFADEKSHAALCYPVRAVWRQRDEQRPGAETVQFVITVPKKRLRLAVDRVCMRRRIREAYRLGRFETPILTPVDISFIYVADRLVDSGRVHRAVRRILADIASKTAPSL